MGMAVYVSGNMVLTQEFCEAVAVLRVPIEIVAFVAMSAVVNVRNRNERLVPEYKNERLPGSP